MKNFYDYFINNFGKTNLINEPNIIDNLTYINYFESYLKGFIYNEKNDAIDTLVTILESFIIGEQDVLELPFEIRDCDLCEVLEDEILEVFGEEAHTQYYKVSNFLIKSDILNKYFLLNYFSPYNSFGYCEEFEGEIFVYDYCENILNYVNQIVASN